MADEETDGFGRSGHPGLEGSTSASNSNQPFPKIVVMPSTIASGQLNTVFPPEVLLYGRTLPT